MATIVTRSGKGSPLTNTEVDSNFTNLNTDKLETSGGTITGDLNVDGDATLGNATTDEHTINGSLEILSTTNEANLTVKTTFSGEAANTPDVKIYNNSTQSGDDNELGLIQFFSNTTNYSEVQFADIVGMAFGTGASDLEGGVRFRFSNGNTASFAANREMSFRPSKIQYFTGATNKTITLQFTDPTADRTITLPDITGTVSLVGATETLTNKTLTTPIIAEIDNSGDITLDAGGDIILDAGGEQIILKDGSTNVGHIDLSNDHLVIKSLVQDKDLAFHGNDGGVIKTLLSFDVSDNGLANFPGGVRGNSYFWMNTDNNVALYAGNNFEIALTHVHNTGFKLTNGGTGTPAVELQFVDSNESIGSDGTNLFLKSGGNAITVPNQSGTIPVLATASTTQITSTPEELNVLDGVTATTAELNYVDGVTSAIQTQLDAKPPLNTISVTVAGGKFVIDGTSQLSMSLVPNVTYRFDQSDSSNANHPIKFSLTSNGTHNSGSAFTTGITSTGTPGSAGAYSDVKLENDAPQVLFYYCQNHSGMGAEINVGNSAIEDHTSLTAGGSTLTIDLAASKHFIVTMTANTTFAFSNIDAGRSGNIVIKEDSTGGYSFTLPSEAKTPLNGATITQQTGANKVSVLSYHVLDSSNILMNYIGDFA